MNKLLVLSLFLATSSYSFAQADNRCGMPTGHPCSEFISRFDAFKKIQDNENDYQQAVDNLSLVESIQKQSNLNLEYTVDNFIYIQQAVGGANATDSARSSFRQVARYISTSNTLHELATQWYRFKLIENDIAQAQGNFDLVMTGVAGGLRLETSSNLFKSLLQLEGGANATGSARASYRMLLNEKNNYPLRDLFESWSKILRAENDREQAAQNFRLVLQAAQKCGSLSTATQDFLSVLQQVGGANSTSQAQDLFKRLYGI